MSSNFIKIIFTGLVLVTTGLIIDKIIKDTNSDPDSDPDPETFLTESEIKEQLEKIQDRNLQIQMLPIA